MSFETPLESDDTLSIEPHETGTWEDPHLIRAVVEMKKRMGLTEHTDESEPEA